MPSYFKKTFNFPSPSDDSNKLVIWSISYHCVMSKLLVSVIIFAVEGDGAEEINGLIKILNLSNLSGFKFSLKR